MYYDCTCFTVELKTKAMMSADKESLVAIWMTMNFSGNLFFNRNRVFILKIEFKSHPSIKLGFQGKGPCNGKATVNTRTSIRPHIKKTDSKNKKEAMVGLDWIVWLRKSPGSFLHPWVWDTCGWENQQLPKRLEVSGGELGVQGKECSTKHGHPQ